MDILIYAAIAVVVFFWLFSILGRRTGHEQERPSIFDVEPQVENENVIALPLSSDHVEKDARDSVRAIQRIDANFTPQNFLLGAKYAFERILHSFSKGDEAALKPLLSDHLFQRFKSVIDQRKASGETQETSLENIKEAIIIGAQLEETHALVTVRFVSEQINVTYDREQHPIDGDADHYTQLTDIWVFKRNLESQDPNWQLMSTRSADAS